MVIIIIKLILVGCINTRLHNLTNLVLEQNVQNFADDSFSAFSPMEIIIFWFTLPKPMMTHSTDALYVSQGHWVSPRHILHILHNGKHISRSF